MYFIRLANVFVFTPHTILCHYFHFVNKCLLNSACMIILVTSIYSEARAHIPIKLFPWPLDPRSVHFTWESFFFIPADKGDKNQQHEFIFSLLMSYVSWLVRLFVMFTMFQKQVRLPYKTCDAIEPWDSEKLHIRQLNAKMCLILPPPAFMVWITITLTFAKK